MWHKAAVIVDESGRWIGVRFLTNPEINDRAFIEADAGWLSLTWPRSVSSCGHACAAHPKGRAAVRLQPSDRRRIDTEGLRYIGRPDRNLSETLSDFEQLLWAEPRLHGYVGGSSAERFPIEKSVVEAGRQFRSVHLPSR